MTPEFVDGFWCGVFAGLIGAGFMAWLYLAAWWFAVR
jgi:hypothetical protein